MKFIHLADLHIGKRVNGFSMVEEDQPHILAEILQIIEAEHPDAVLIAGDVYDRSIPSEGAVNLLDDFLAQLAAQKLEILLISGNHDSAERLAFGNKLLTAGGVHISPVYKGRITTVTLEDDHGPVRFWLFPFLKPAHVAQFADHRPESYAEAMQLVLEQCEINAEERNVALVHQFLTGGTTSDSEERSIGGLDDIPAALFERFDYTALGHLHGPQMVGSERIRYAGSPLKYSFSEWQQDKSVTVVELGEKGDVAIRTVPLHPLRDMKRISGEFDLLMSDTEATDDYYEITLTDEEDVPNALNKLRVKFPNLMVLRYNNTRTRKESVILNSDVSTTRSPLELFDELYEQQNGQYLNEAQRSYLMGLIREIWEEEV